MAPAGAEAIGTGEAVEEAVIEAFGVVEAEEAEAIGGFGAEVVAAIGGIAVVTAEVAALLRHPTVPWPESFPVWGTWVLPQVLGRH